jgi:hypothetical protein
MKKLHEKLSPCCRAKTYKFGGKRRQCSLCKKTWTVWAKKRGAKPSRPNRKLLEKILIEKRSLLSPGMTRKPLAKSTLSARLTKAMRSCLSKSSEAFGDGPVILIIDALWFQFKDVRWTLYLGAIRDIDSNQAEILEPKLVCGRECYLGWKSFVDDLPDSFKTRVKAVVADGFRGIDRIARIQNWILQRCHFHLIAQLQARLGYWKKMPDTPIRKEIYHTVAGLLVARENKKELENHLRSLIKKPSCPRRLKMIASEFLRRLHQFRAYTIYPELKLPATTNSVESLNRIIRSRCKHISTPESMLLRVKALIKMKRTITCNPKIFNRN